LELLLQVLFILSLIPEFPRQKIAEYESNYLVCVSRAREAVENETLESHNGDIGNNGHIVESAK
jgi:hypothetical protein